MFAVVLAGGSGTRLRPLTYARRKELVPILDRPLLEYRFRNLKEHGVEDIVIACSQGAGEIEERFGDGAALGVRLRYVYEERPLGSGRAVKEAAHAAGANGTLVVCNGDILTNIDLALMLARHRETGATLSISLAPVDEPWHYGVVAVDDELRISHFVEKPPQGAEPSRLINAGTWLFEPEVLSRVPEDETAVRDGYSEHVLFPGIIADGLRVQGFEEDLWVDVGSPERYLRANRLLLDRAVAGLPSGVRREGAEIDARAIVTGPAFIGPGAKVGAGARIEGPAVIGHGATIEEGARVAASVLWEGARVRARADVQDSIVADGAVVGAGVRLRDSVLASGARVEDGAAPEDGARVMPGEEVRA